MLQIFLLLFAVLYFVSFLVLGRYRRLDKEEYLFGDEADSTVYHISLWLSSFSLAVSTGAALLLPISIVSNEVLLLYPESLYVNWLNSSLIQGNYKALKAENRKSVVVDGNQREEVKVVLTFLQLLQVMYG